VVTAFEKSLLNMTERLQNLAAASEQKVDLPVQPFFSLIFHACDIGRVVCCQYCSNYLDITSSSTRPSTKY